MGVNFDPIRITRVWPVYERDTLFVIYIVRNPFGVTREGIVQIIKASFELSIIPELLDVITRETNMEANRICTEWNAAHPDNRKVWVPLVLT